MSELKDINDALRVIAKYIGELEGSVKSYLQRDHSGLMSAGKAMEKHWEGLRESKREQREERQLENTVNQNSLLKQQNFLLLITLVITAISSIGALIVNIINLLRK